MASLVILPTITKRALCLLKLCISVLTGYRLLKKADFFAHLKCCFFFDKMDYDLKSSIYQRYFEVIKENDKRSEQNIVESQIAKVRGMIRIGDKSYSIYHDNTQTTITVSDNFGVRNLMKKPENLKNKDVYRVTIRLETRPNTSHPKFLTEIIKHQNFIKL